MLIVDWAAIVEIEEIPFFGDELTTHLHSYSGKVRHSSCAAWGLLFQKLQDNNIPVSLVSFTDTGKPFFLDNHIHFSISHSHELCAVAISDHLVGVDIEIVKAHYNPRMFDRSLCDNEKRVFDGDFTRIWVRKEAVAKMTGKGIVGYPVDIDTTQYQFKEKRISFGQNEYWCGAISGD